MNFFLCLLSEVSNLPDFSLW